MNANVSRSDDASLHAPAPEAPRARLSVTSAFDFWRTAHRILRGRYRTVLAITLLGVATGAYAGFTFGKRLYSATGLVRIASALPAVLKETDQNRPMANFDGFIQAQREVMSGREVVDAAMKEDSWTKLGSRRRAVTSEQFAAGLTVQTRARSDFLQVKFTHKDPLVAAAAIQSVISAYKQVFTREQAKAEGPRMDLLQRRRAGLSADQAKLEAKINETASGRTLTVVESLCLEASERARKLRSAITDLHIAAAGGTEIRKATDAPVQPGVDPTLDDNHWFISLETKLERELFLARGRGLRDGHPTIVRLQNSLDACRSQILALPRSPGAPAPSASQPALAVDPTPRLLMEREGKLRILLDSALAEMKQLSSEREKLKGLDEQAVALRQQLADTDSRLDALTTEASLGGRLMVVSGGDRPMTALLDNRIKMTAAGSVIGGAAPFGILMLSAMFRRRYRSGEEVAEDLAEHVPFVAVVPEVEGPGAMGMMAARCIHDIRARLQPHVAQEPRTYLVASVSPGDGKTALCMALGFSFAAAGVRTLVIDGDLSDRHLTKEFGANEAPGLIDALAGGEPFVQHIRTGPSVLAAGRSSSHDANKLVPAALRRVLASLRDKFDIILIDGDPILTGITTTVIAPQSDGVILAVGNGQRPSRVLQAVNQIHMMGTDLVAGVFNRADPSELPVDLKAREEADAVRHRTLPDKVRAFGPLIGAVLASLQHTRNEDVELRSGELDLAKTDRAPHTPNTGDTAHEPHQGRAEGRAAA